MAETITIRIETERLVLQETPGFLRVMATKRCNIDRLALDKNGSIMPDLVIAQQYTKRFQDRMDKFDTYLEEARNKRHGIAVYGTGYFFTNLVAFTSLRLKEIVCACDSNPKKWGVIIPGLKEPVQPPERISHSQIGLVVVTTQNYEGVLSRLKSYLEQGGMALVLFPEPRIIENPL